MEMQYFKDYSPTMGREMECKLYGHGGKPILYIPTQDGRFYSFEDMGMLNALRPWLDAGKAMVLSIDTIDTESWSDKGGEPYRRARRYEAWMEYITREVVPFLRALANEKNGWDGYPGIMAFGCSLGATHAANLYFRFPDLFDTLLGLSGIYTADYGFDGYWDEVVYRNSPVNYLADMPLDHPFIQRYKQNKGILCVGQGDWEIPESTREMARICEAKGIPLWVDLWGYDVKHDWDWWFKQVDYFLPFLLDDRT